MVAKLDDYNRELTMTAKATRTGKKNRFIKQNNFAHAMLYIFQPSLYDCDMKLPNFTLPLYGR